MQRILIVVVTVLAATVALEAQVNRAYVSARSGNDSNPCSFASPCRSIGAAITHLNSGGEVIILEGGGFTPFTVDRSVSIQAPPSVFAGVIVGSGSAVRITAPEVRVVLRGLTLTGVPGAFAGIEVVADGVQLHVENVVAHGFTNASGIRIASRPGRLFVHNSTFRNNLSGIFGVGDFLDPLEVSISNSSFHGNSNTGITLISARGVLVDSSSVGSSYGLFASDEGTRVSATRFTADSNSLGVYAQTNADIALENCTLTLNGDGARSIGGAIAVSGSAIHFNDTGVSTASGGTVVTRGNNTFHGNGTDGTFTGSITPK